MAGLVLEVLDFKPPLAWRWRLSDGTGSFVADHAVDLGSGVWQAEAFRDLYGYIRWHVAPDQRMRREVEILADVGNWIGSEVLGPVGAALAQLHRPVRMVIPPGAGVVGLLPWEAARVNGKLLAAHRVSVIVDQQPRSDVTKFQVGSQLRMLAIFSLPDGAGALNLRKERHRLARLVNNLAKVNNKAIELRVVQYGVTRDRLEEVLLEADGWDVVHLSGHGLRGGLVLETASGGRDLVPSTELVDLLELDADRLKLVTLSACESAAVTAKQHLHLLGLDKDSATEVPNDVPEAGGLSSVAGRLVERLDCAVLAMRFPVVDEFSIALADTFYDLVFGKGQPVDRALALTIPKVIAAVPSAPAVSMATPALFGGTAVNLKLVPPTGQPAVLALERQHMAGFQPQPERFVGRVGALARATRVLAPNSGRSGLVFNGMAGAGKTSCALELAYTHQDAFQGLVWWEAPAEGENIATALINFGLAVEQKLGLRLVHTLATAEALCQAAPALTELMEQNRLLLMIDNAESLVTETGDWRDAKWGLLVEALTAHRGLSRLVLTSRRLPASLDMRVDVEVVHALTLAESMLLARELPNLARLLNGVELPDRLSAEGARALVGRTLRVVQGHPKLIELADGLASDPDQLEARLDEANRTWADHGTRLDAFLSRGETSADADDFAAVLHGWANTATHMLDAATRTFFQYLACIEPEDRVPIVVDGNWSDLWAAIGRPGDPPNAAALLPTLAGRGLVETLTDPETAAVVGYRIHPGIAEAARDTAGSAFGTAVDEELANYWLANLNYGHLREQEGNSWLVTRAARSAAPYLLRRHRWRDLSIACESLLERDFSTGAAGFVLPILTSALQASTHPGVGLHLGRTQAAALQRIDPEQAEVRYRELLETALGEKDYGWATTIEGDLANLYQDWGRLKEALTLLDAKIEHSRLAGFGVWSELVDQGIRLQIRYRQGHQREVLEAGLQLREQMANLAEPPEPEEPMVVTWNVRETLLNILVLAARDSGEDELALTLNAEITASQRRREASTLEQAGTAFNNSAPLIHMGRLDEARNLLIECRDVFLTANATSSLGKTLQALGIVESQLGHISQAAALERDALRYHYLARDPAPIAMGHYNLAKYLSQSHGDAGQAAAHDTAGVLIAILIGDSGVYRDGLLALGQLLQARPEAAPASVADVCASVDQVQGVRLGALLDRLSPPDDWRPILDTILQDAHEAVVEYERSLIRAWDAVLAALRAALHGPEGEKREAERVLDDSLAHLAQVQGAVTLVQVLRRIQAGERDHDTLVAGLSHIDAFIAGRALDLLAGLDIGIRPDSWRDPARHSDDGEWRGDNDV